jgi:hypothetical protein
MMRASRHSQPNPDTRRSGGFSFLCQGIQSDISLQTEVWAGVYIQTHISNCQTILVHASVLPPSVRSAKYVPRPRNDLPPSIRDRTRFYSVFGNHAVSNQCAGKQIEKAQVKATQFKPAQSGNPKRRSNKFGRVIYRRCARN